MKLSDAFQFKYLPPTAHLLGVNTFAEVKVGRGLLRYVWVIDDLGLSGAQYTVYDGVLTPGPPGQSPTVTGQLMFDRALVNIGPMCVTFFNGLVVQYTNNQPQVSGFVSYR